MAAGRMTGGSSHEAEKSAEGVFHGICVIAVSLDCSVLHSPSALPSDLIPVPGKHCSFLAIQDSVERVRTSHSLSR